ncbi:SMI1/KNR4 family protein, partial [Micromonospora sp. NPDC006431]|uniref:SMI1/KNR4 family protein n=1 Tax=Micromonospora sp. NPDC006431 TaxID=3364235 RepID=UPI0036C533BF
NHKFPLQGRHFRSSTRRRTAHPGDHHESPRLELAASTPRDPAMFGASAHRFRIGPPLSENSVAAFEQQHRVRLPTDYRAFITKVGHGGPGQFGGAGPYYGLHPLEDWDMVLWDTPDAGTLAKPFPAEPGRVYEDWLAEVAPGDEDEPYRGTLTLSDQGCGYMSLLVVTGPARGRITDNCERDEGPVFTADRDFLSWYERWLDAVLAGEQHFR